MNNGYYKHETAIVETDSVGERTKIWAYVHILKNTIIGKNATICDHCFVEDGVEVGNNVTIKCGVYLWDGLRVEDNVFIGPNATFTNDKLPRSKNRNYHKLSTILKKGCSIGANATILPGIEIGEYAMVAAGSVVTKSIPNFALVIGSPARLKGYVCQCGEKLNFIEDSAVCSCGEKFAIQNKKVLKKS